MALSKRIINSIDKSMGTLGYNIPFPTRHCDAEASPCKSR
ncbi:hypothetical protein LOK49_LG06G00197 [Camellia lanceoleosa]|uniref:Uncharacterized protein n=1 Tax=Camellia lanceoleosa TaxID=1840588 RepID=A0ACC0HC71_9ERIC|nr:hypothetical protein LOK49_LG06G00197 [Camellia lanceoleosa]